MTPQQLYDILNKTQQNHNSENLLVTRLGPKHQPLIIIKLIENQKLHHYFIEKLNTKTQLVYQIKILQNKKVKSENSPVKIEHTQIIPTPIINPLKQYLRQNNLDILLKI